MNIRIISYTLLVALCAARSALCANSATPTYSQVRAILVQRCMSCHDAEEADGDLVMESHESLMKGGEKGADIIPGKADQSRLVTQIEHKTKPFMPPPKKAPALPAEEIATIRAWIDAGAPGPRPGEIVAALPTTQAVPAIHPRGEVRRPVLSLAYEPKLDIVAAARPGEVEIWSVQQQAVLHHFTKLPGDVNAVAFSADGTRLYAGGGDPGVTGRVWIWNVADWKLVRTFDGHSDAIYSIAISPDGKTLATGSYDQKVLLWNIDSNAPPRTLAGHNGAVFGVAFRPDGKVLASVSADRTLKLWDVQTAARLDTRPEAVKDLNAVAWSPDGSRVAAGGVDNRIRIWKVSPSAVEGTNTLEISKFAHDGTILRLAWSPDAALILSSADDRTVRLFNAADMTQKLTFPPQQDWPSALTFAGGSKVAVLGRLDGAIAFYDTANGKEIAPPKPVVTLVSPRGVQRGTAARIKFSGTNLSRVTAVKITGGAGRNVVAKLTGESTANEAWAEITTPADAPLESFEVALASPGGDSAAMKLFVDNLPQVQYQPPLAGPHATHETADPNVAADPRGATVPRGTGGPPVSSPSTGLQIIDLPASVWGTFAAAGEADRLAVTLKKGQTAVFDVAAKRLGSKAQVELTLLDDAAHVLAYSADSGEDADPLISFTAPADGRYSLKLADLAGGGSMENFYRISIGDFAYVTGTFPLAVPANAESKVQLLGANLPPDTSATIKAGGEGEAEIPLDPNRFRTRRAMKVLVSGVPELLETEPNDSPAQAMPIPVPSAVNGRIAAPGDADLYRFGAQAGATYIIETMAARRGSPVDTRIEVLHPDGRPVQRLALRAVRDSNIVFRGFDAGATGARFPNYAEMDLNQYVYMNGEVARLFKYPEGPDSEFGFYTLAGKRRCYFDTSATSHPLDEKCYIVELHAPDEKLAPNGLPVIPLFYENDDDGDRLLGSDSRLTFTAPASGPYLVRVTDTRNFGGPDYVYRLIIRPAKPDFSVAIEGYNANPPAGAGREFTVKLNRIDGFDGPVRVEISNPPPGFMVSSPVVVEAGQWEAEGTIYADPGASTAMPAASAAGLKVKASAIIDGKELTRELPDLKLPWAGAKSQVFLVLEAETPDKNAASAAQPGRITITPGKLTRARLRVIRNGYTGTVSFEPRNFPFGVRVADMGLNGVQILEGQTEREIFIQCAPWVTSANRPCHMRIKEIGAPTTPPVILSVDENPPTAASAKTK